MPRWRRPREKSSPYITPEGYRALESELQALWAQRTEVTRALAAAAAEGDRSENAEYIYRKKELRGIDSRIAYLQRRMPDLNIVSRVSDQQQVFFGATVTLATQTGEKLRYRIVGGDELGKGGQYISIDSPLARALLGKSVGEVIELESDGPTVRYVLVDLAY